MFFLLLAVTLFTGFNSCANFRQPEKVFKVSSLKLLKTKLDKINAKTKKKVWGSSLLMQETKIGISLGRDKLVASPIGKVGYTPLIEEKNSTQHAVINNTGPASIRQLNNTK
jgi:hypothetical protein